MELITILGYTDNAGSYEDNTLLSQRRADAVRAYLVSKGLPHDRLKAHGEGPEDPVADNGSLGYSIGEQINGLNGGYYYIYANAGETGQAVGQVAISSYLDATTGHAYTPATFSQLGHSLGSGLGNDHDYITGADTHTLMAFGSGGTYEAKNS